MALLGHIYCHVEASDENGERYGIYSGESIHTRERIDKTGDPYGKYDYLTLPATDKEYDDFFKYFVKKKPNSMFNYSIYLIFFRVNMGENRYYCSQLIAQALLNSVYAHRKDWPPPHNITPDKLYDLIKNDACIGSDVRTKIILGLSNV